MTKNKNYILQLLTALGMLNMLWLLYFICTTDHSYLIATIPEAYFFWILVYIPVLLTVGAFAVFLFDLLRRREKDWFAFVAAFTAILTDAVFAIGTLYFTGH